MPDNRDIYLQVLDAASRADADTLARLIAPGMVDHNPIPGQAPGLPGFLQWMGAVHAALGDVHVAVEDVLAEGDRVAGRVVWSGNHHGEFLGAAATGKRLSFPAMHIVRFADGQVVEWWGLADFADARQQLVSESV